MSKPKSDEWKKAHGEKMRAYWQKRKQAEQSVKVEGGKDGNTNTDV